MNKLILWALLLSLAASAYAQGWIELNNIDNNNTSTTATRNGLFFIDNGSGPVLVNSDFDVSFYGGSSSDSLALLQTFINSGGGGIGGPGKFIDTSETVYSIPGAP